MTTFDSSPNARPMPVPGESSIQEVSDYFFNYRPADLWRDTLQTNIGAVFTTSMAFLPLLDAGNKRRAKDLPKSQIIAIGSTGGLTRFTQSFIYNASKVSNPWSPCVRRSTDQISLLGRRSSPNEESWRLSRTL